MELLESFTGLMVKPPVSDDLLRALGLAIRLDDDDTALADEMFGTKKPQHVGDSWSIDANKIIYLLDDLQIDVEAKTSPGSQP